jgi:hypothetical protein
MQFIFGNLANHKFILLLDNFLLSKTGRDTAILIPCLRYQCYHISFFIQRGKGQVTDVSVYPLDLLTTIQDLNLQIFDCESYHVAIISHRCEFVQKNLVVIHLGTAPKKLCYQTFPWLVLDKSA